MGWVDGLMIRAATLSIFRSFLVTRSHTLQLYPQCCFGDVDNIELEYTDGYHGNEDTYGSQADKVESSKSKS